MTETPEDPEIGYQLDALATVVRSELAAAGLPVVPDDHPLGTAGAMVWTDRPKMRGVLVRWHAHPVLMDAGQAAWAEDPFREGEECLAFQRLINGISAAMKEAMREIMTVAGLNVIEADNPYAPSELLVVSRVAPSPWRARHNAVFVRQYGDIQAAIDESDRNHDDQP